MLDYIGHPFRDACVAALTVMAGKDDPREVTLADIEKAVEELSALVTKAVESGRLKLGSFFQNLTSVQAAVRRYSLEDTIERTPTLGHVLGLVRKEASAKEEEKSHYCPLCARPYAHGVKVSGGQVPLLSGKFNFYPAGDEDFSVCPTCALSFYFLPAASFTPQNGKRWIAHTAHREAMTKIAAIAVELSRVLALADEEPATALRSAKTDYQRILFLLHELLANRRFHRVFPFTVYQFQNAANARCLKVIDVPTTIMKFLHRLRKLSRKAYDAFLRVVAKNDTFAWATVARLPVIRYDRKAEAGWLAHACYAEEVLNVGTYIIRIIELLGQYFALEENKKAFFELKKAETAAHLRGVFLRAVRAGAITSQQFYHVLQALPSVLDLRDYVLAVAELVKQGSFEPTPVGGGGDDAPDAPECDRIQDIAERVAPMSQVKRFATNLATARSVNDIRGACLEPVRRGVITFNEFCFLVPPDDVTEAYARRDYLLAALYERGVHE